jgi:hypothetical protein
MSLKLSEKRGIINTLSHKSEICYLSNSILHDVNLVLCFTNLALKALQKNRGLDVRCFTLQIVACEWSALLTGCFTPEKELQIPPQQELYLAFTLDRYTFLYLADSWM